MSYSAEVLADSPWLYWRLEETGAAATAQDETANNRDGTYTGTTQGVAGAVDGGNAVTFDGVDDKVLGGVALPAGDLTIEQWVKIPSTPASSGYLHMLSDGVGGGGGVETFVNTNRRIQARMWVGSEVVTPDSGTQLVAGQWHHIALRLDGTNAKIYVDGAESSTVACGTIVDARPVCVGGAGGAGFASIYAHSADDVAVWASALSPARIAAHFAAASASGGVARTNYTRFPKPKLRQIATAYL